MPYCPICEKCLCKPVKIPHNEASKKPDNQLRKYKGNFAKLEGQFPNDAKYGGGIVSSKCGHLFHQNCLHEYITTFRTKGDCYGATYNALCPICGQNLCCGKMLKIDIEAHFGILEEFFQGLYKLKYMNKELKRTLETEWAEIAGLEKKIETSKQEYEHYKGMKRATEERCGQQEERIAKAIEDANTCFRYREIEKQLLDENVNLEAVARRMEKIISTRHQPSESSSSSSTTLITSDNENTEDAQITSYDSVEEPQVHSKHQVDISLQISVQSEWSSETGGRVSESLQDIQRQEINHQHADNLTVRRVSSTQILCRARGVPASDLHHAEQWAIQQVSQEMLTVHDWTRNQDQTTRKLQGSDNSEAVKRCPTHNVVIQQVSQHLLCRQELPKGQRMGALNFQTQSNEHNETKLERKARDFASTAAGKSRSYTIRDFNNIQDSLKNTLESQTVLLGNGPEDPKMSLAKKRSYTIKVHGGPENIPQVNTGKNIDTLDKNDASSVTPDDSKCAQIAPSTDLVDFLVVSCNDSDEGKLPTAKPTLTDIHLEQVASKLEQIVQGKCSRIKPKRKTSNVDFRPFLFPPSPVGKVQPIMGAVDVPKHKKFEVLPESLQVQEFSINPGPRQRAAGSIKDQKKIQKHSTPASKIQLKPAEGVTFTVKVEPRPSHNSFKAEQNQRQLPPRVKVEVKKPQALSKSTVVETKTQPEKPLKMKALSKKMPPVPPKIEQTVRNEIRSPAFDFIHLIVPPPPPLSHNSTVSALLVPPPPPMTPQDRALHVSTPNSTRKFIENLLDSSDNLLSTADPSYPPVTPFVPPPPVISSADELIEIVPPPPALDLFSNDLDLSNESEDELLKSVISQSTSLQVQTDSTSTVNETGAGDVIRYPPSKYHTSSSTPSKEFPQKCLAAQRFANAFRQSQPVLNTGANIPAQSPRYVYYGHKADGIRQQDYNHNNSFHQFGTFQYETMPVTPIVIERNPGSGQEPQAVMALSSEVYTGSHSRTNNWLGKSSPQALSSLLAEQSCMDFYRNLNKKCFP